MDYRKVAGDIIDHVGGKGNIKNVTHCFTRLRFVLKDESRASKEEVEHLEGVISVVISAGQFQVVCGAKVTKIYDAAIELLGGEGGDDDSEDVIAKEKPGIGNLILQKVTEMFTPLVPAIAAAGLIKGLLTAAKLIMSKYGVDISATDTYNILYSASQVIFYFLPIFLAMTCAKALKCNQVIAMAIGATLVYPAIDAMIQDTAVKTTIFGLPIMKSAWQIGESVKVFSYTESVIPIIPAVLVMAFLEKQLKKIIPEILQIILAPGLELIIMLPLTFVVLGPVGIYVGNGIQFVYDSIMNVSTVLGGALIGGLWCVCVVFGAHRALLPIGLNDVAVNGHQNLLAFAGAANFSQGGAALGVMLKTKSKDLKQVAASSFIAATLVGITEPAIYGCNLRLKKPMVYAVICGAVGGAVMGLGNVYGDAFANNGALTIFTYAAYGMTKFIFYLVGIGISFFGAAALTYFLGFEDLDAKPAKKVSAPAAKRRSIAGGRQAAATGSEAADIEITAPVQGKAYRLTEVQDQVFSSEALGKGIAILPTKGEVVAPADCTVSVLYPTGHAMGLVLDNGVELLIHIGMDTVNMEGDGFEQFVKQGDVIKKGTKIVGFDIDKIKKAGYDTTVSVIVSNTADYTDVVGTEMEQTDYDSGVIMAVR